MADYAGYSSPPAAYSLTPTIPGGFTRTLEPPKYWIGQPATYNAAGARASNVPVDVEPKRSLTGASAPRFGMLDFYNDIHASSVFINMGSITSIQVRELRIFNAYFVQRTLLSITPTNAGGVDLTEPAPTPLRFQPLQEYTYQVTVSPAGPPTVDADFLFTFDVASFNVNVVGERVIAWTWAPDWSSPVIERYEWATDVIPSYAAYEQRRPLRQNPRWSYRFSFWEEGEERARLENALYSWGARVWALPIWPDETALTAQGTAGALSVALDTTTRDFHPEGLALLRDPATGNTETLLIESVASGSLTLSLPLLSTWPAGALIAPLRLARLAPSQPVARKTADLLAGEAAFILQDHPSKTALSESTYRGYPVMLDRFNWIEEPQQSMDRKVGITDNLIRPALWVDESGVPGILQQGLWTTMSRSESDTLRRWLYARRGRLKGLWVPTWAPDLVLVATVTNVALNIDVRHRNLTSRVDAGKNRRDIRIELNNGTVFYRRVSGFTVVSSTVERMTISSALGQQVEPADVKLISFMALSRLDTDAVDIAWSNNEVANAQIAMRSFNSDA